MAQNIFTTLYNDFIKPLQNQLLIFLMLIIFAVAGYFGYLWYVKPTVENLNNDDVSNNNRRISEAQIMFFSADWCPHCKKAKPEWNDFTSEYDGKEVGFYKISCQSVDCTDGNNELIQEYSIDGYPTIILLKDNKRIDYDARITHENMKQFVEDTLANK
jgi:thiol-disulfide isomerase/thioredoxin